MKKYFCCGMLFCVLSFYVTAQTTTFDKARAMDLLQDQQYEEAINYLSPIVDKDSSNAQALGLLAYACYMNDNRDRAEKLFQRAVDIDSSNSKALRYLALLKTDAEPELAKLLTMRLIVLQPGKAIYHRNMGDLLRRTNQKDSALVYYSDAYTLSPGDYKNAAALCVLLLENKSYIRADSILDNGLLVDSLNLSYLKLRIRSAYETKNYQAIPALGEHFMQTGEAALGVLTQVALAYYNLDRYTDCIRVCGYMEEKGIAVESIYYYEAKSWAKLKDYKKSNDLLQTCLALSLSKTSELYFYNLGENDEALGLYKAAIKQYDTAFYLFKNPLMKYNCGRISESKLNNKKLAQRYYDQYLVFAKPVSADEKKAYAYVREKWGKKKKLTVDR